MLGHSSSEVYVCTTNGSVGWLQRDGRIQLDVVLTHSQYRLAREPLYPCQQIWIQFVRMGPQHPVAAIVFSDR
jgi:hypothetical protein